MNQMKALYCHLPSHHNFSFMLSGGLQVRNPLLKTSIKSEVDIYFTLKAENVDEVIEEVMM